MDSEIIIVRSLTESDLGLFAAHRAAATSKQRAIQMNVPVVRRLLSDEAFARGAVELSSTCTFGDTVNHEDRWLGKTGKNWRLGGNQIKGEVFAQLDCKDFLLLRSKVGNNGDTPITITFISRSTDRLLHAGLVAIVEKTLSSSMSVFEEGDALFASIARYCVSDRDALLNHEAPRKPILKEPAPKAVIAPMPEDEVATKKHRSRTVKERLKTPHILERMLKVAGDLSAPAQLRFMETVGELASQLRAVLLETGGIVKIEKDHPSLWRKVAGKPIGFVDGGLANLSMLGSAPIAARVGGYIVTPGDQSPERERFSMLKHLIDELYANDEDGAYDDTFPDIGALRDAARISIEAAGAVQMLRETSNISTIFMHGALVNPVSRYTDVMKDGQIRHRFPNFSKSAIAELLPGEAHRRDSRERNFISVYLRQLELLQEASAVVCGVIERESTTNSVLRAVLSSLDDHELKDLLPVPPHEWKAWFLHAVDPADDDDFEGQRITDPLLFRCLLEPGEALRPVVLDRNLLRKAPLAWQEEIGKYPKPRVSYLQVTEWSAPIRMELFEKDAAEFESTAELVMHCSLLLPHYAFPVGLDIVDKFAKVPNWMSRPINTFTAVQALKKALDNEDAKLFDGLRRMLCGSGREWLLRPTIGR
ncbi:hypothetical protein CYG48_13380 [Neorhizobium sp. SOG26]|uniref:DNA double-strand break repair nuclease NurA n=1 Tax=Neorhizobium sp. SOG26 TaxID=2060726 RepID=UPI000E572C71|nr:DNA double-strand break repair nuclease NurA [Neorhizobium sp. SOG26]AXV16592.1 hypothetical protein CYG48_13380 [Neorhizobium sp. SOG26]